VEIILIEKKKTIFSLWVWFGSETGFASQGVHMIISGHVTVFENLDLFQ
jgi:hypothetical protein